MSLHTVDKPSTVGRVASRRNVVRGAAWTGAAVTIVVATPNIAAASTVASMSGTRNGTNFTVTISGYTGTISTVQIGAVVATPAGTNSFTAKLGGSAPATQNVIVTFASGKVVQQGVTFN